MYVCMPYVVCSVMWCNAMQCMFNVGANVNVNASVDAKANAIVNVNVNIMYYNVMLCMHVMYACNTCNVM